MRGRNYFLISILIADKFSGDYYTKYGSEIPLKGKDFIAILV